jgi:outer membrane protein assembly factor BamB
MADAEHTQETKRRPDLRALTVAVVFSAAAVGGCADSLPSLPKLTDLNPFAEKQVPLPGKRVPIITDGNRVGGELATAERPIAIPASLTNDSWTQPGGTASNAPGHLALNGSVRTVWSGDAGSGSSSSGKVSASPIVYDGRVYTLDATGRVTAFSISGGGVAWRTPLIPEGEKNANKGYGGGLAADSGRIYAATGFGTIVALDPRSGKKLWERNIGVPFRASPTAAADRVYAVSIEGGVYSLSGADGAENWTYRGIPEKASIISNASPAVDGDTVVVPFSSGEVIGLRASNGQVIWTDSLARTRSASSLAAMSDAARPAIDGGVAFAVGHAGRMVAVNARTGERLWSLSIPSIQQPWVAGDNVFVVDTEGQVIAISKRDGKILWTTKLPGEAKWSGPVLAGNKLWLTSSKGALASVEALTGKVAGTQDLGAPVYIGPVIAGGRMFVMTDNARVLALN